jgi:hypothetical protein
METHKLTTKIMAKMLKIACHWSSWVNSYGTFSTGNPTPLFHSQLRAQVSSTDLFNYDVSKDGQRFLVNRYAKPPQVTPLHIVLNTTAPLQK